VRGVGGASRKVNTSMEFKLELISGILKIKNE